MAAKISLFGLDKNKTMMALCALAQSVPFAPIAENLEQIMKGETTEVKEDTKKFLNENKDQILEMVQNIEAMREED